MVALKAAQTPAFVRKPDMRFSAALIYGPEQSLVAERARELTRSISSSAQPEAEVVRLDDRDLAENSDRLAIELQTRSMFAERRIVHIKAERRLKPEDIEGLLDDGLDAYLIVEAGNLRPTAKLRKLFEARGNVAALPCYADAARDIATVIDQVILADGLRMSGEVHAYLASRLGTDPALARSECTKLATYAAGTNEVTAEDVDAIIGNLGAGLIDALTSAVAEGKTQTALTHLDALIASGLPPNTALTALNRYFQRLHRLCAAIEGGEPASNAINHFRPPLHFKQRDALLAHARKWSKKATAAALRKVQETTRGARRAPGLEAELTSELLIVLSS